MPLGAYRLNSLARYVPPAGRDALAITAVGDVQIDTADSKFGGGSILFDGTGDYLSIPDTADTLEFGTGDWTIEFWVKWNSAAVTQVIWDQRPFGTSQFTYAAPVIYNTVSGGNIVLRYYFTASRIDTVLSTGTWYHIAVVRSSGTTKMYIDGVADAQTYTTTTSHLSDGLRIGLNGTAGNTNYFNGALDEIRVSNIARYTADFTPPTSAFTNDSNTLLLIHGDGTDGSTTFTDDNGTGRSRVGISAIGNAQVDTADSKFGGASYLGDRSNKGYLDCNTTIIPATGPFTVECWVNFDVVDGDTWIITQYGNSESGRCVLYTGGTGGKIVFFASSAIVTSTTIPSIGVWYHIAVCRDEDNEFRLYVNGTLEHSVTSTRVISTSRNTRIGQGFDPTDDSRYLDGHIDEVRISNIARYTTSFTPSTIPFVNDSDTLLLLHMDGTDGSTTFTDDNS